MTVFTKRAVDVFSPTTAGGTARGADMGETGVWGTEVERAIEGAAAGRVDQVTWSDLNDTTGTRYGQPARVLGPDPGAHTDPIVGGTVPNVGEYIWWTVPAGWRRISNLQQDLVHASNTGAGTANDVKATSDVQFSATAYATLITVNFVAANTGAMTISINGEMPRALVLNRIGAVPVPAGYIQPGMAALVQIDSDGNYRLFSYGDASAIQAAVEAILLETQDARDAALAAASSVIAPKATISQVEADAPDIDPEYYRVDYRDTSYVANSGGKYRKVASEPSHPGKIQNANGTWYELQSLPIYPQMFGAKGDGVAFDEDALNDSGQVASALRSYVSLMDKTYLVRTSKVKAGLNTGTRNYALESYDNMAWVGFKGLGCIKIADGQSSDASPKDCNIFMPTAAAMKNHSFYGVIFNMNGQNNLFSADRDSGVYGRPCNGAYDLTGDDAWVDGLSFKKCQFINCAGTNCIVTGQSVNGVAGPLSQNFILKECRFYNNGLDTDDHSSVYAWAENVWATDNVFEQPASLPKTGKNWVSFEIHGANTWYCRNKIKNYYRGCWIASNFTRPANNLHIESNDFDCWFAGPSLFRQLSVLTGVFDVHILNNNITIRPGASTGFRSGIELVPAYACSSIHIRGNKLEAVKGSGDTAYNSAAINISISQPGETFRQIYISDNHAIGFQAGVYARVNDGNGVLDEIHEHDNNYDWLGLTYGATDTVIGSRFQQGGSSVIGKISSKNNRYTALSGRNWDDGIYLSGAISDADIDGHVFIGQTAKIVNNATITRRRGKQLCSGGDAPTSGTWEAGDRFYCTSPSRVRNISEWSYSGATWRAFGSGIGTTAERPALTAQDGGYSYFDTDITKFILWDGSGWRV